jgi:hypothetical protein
MAHYGSSAAQNTEAVHAAPSMIQKTCCVWYVFIKESSILEIWSGLVVNHSFLPIRCCHSRGPISYDGPSLCLLSVLTSPRLSGMKTHFKVGRH